MNRQNSTGCVKVAGLMLLVTASSAAAGANAADASVRSTDSAAATTTPGDHPTDQIAPIRPSALPVGTEIKTHAVVAGAGEGNAPVPTDAAASAARLVYSNTLGRYVFGPVETLPPAWPIADDIVTTAIAGCILDRYTTIVSGDKDGDGSGVGPFSVDIALYETCPGARFGTTPIPISGTQTHVNLPDNGLHEITVTPWATVELPGSFYLGMSFSRQHCGIVVGAPATLGHSADSFDYPGSPCKGYFGGYPDYPHASFYAQIYAREECVRAHVGYRNSMQAGDHFTPGAGIRFADDLHLGVNDCNLVAYEFVVKGTGVVDVDLRTSLDDNDPEQGGVIPNTVTRLFLTQEDLRIGHVDVSPPVPVPQDLWITFKTSSSVVGPIVTDRQASLGHTDGLHARHDGTEWRFQPLPGGFDYAAFDATIWCEGDPPVGACCDTIQTDEGGEAVCRQLPEMNCPFNRWIEGEACDPDPFEPACGLSACCTPDDTCENLTRNECEALVPPDARILWNREQPCEDDEFFCPFHACLQREDDCSVARPNVGCGDPFCCQPVCELDPWCCQGAWDRRCVQLAQEHCTSRPWNDSCFDERQFKPGAYPIDSNCTVVIGNTHATQDEDDPGFSCHRAAPGAPGFHTIWFAFEATRTSARIHTCNSEMPPDDSVLAVYRVGDPSTPESACTTLEEIACNDDKPGCGTGYTSGLCVEGLVPEETYYIQLASRNEAGGGVHQLDIQSPCPHDPRPECPPDKIEWLDPPDGVVDARRSHTSDKPQILEGIDMLLAATSEGSEEISCWSLCDTAVRGSPNDISDVADNGDGTLSIELIRPITPGAVTVVTYTDDNGTTTTGQFTAHPSNTNADGIADATDIFFLIDVLNGQRPAPWGRFSTDCDHSSETIAADILCVIDLLNGALGLPASYETPLPTMDDGCRRICGGLYGFECRQYQFCKAAEGSCQTEDDYGACTLIPQVCPDAYDSVCGCDGLTYSNECYADAAGISIDHHGECEP